MSGQELRPGDQQATAIFRIVQEALNNVAQHAYASQVTVQVTAAKQRGRIEVRGNGCSINNSRQACKRGFGSMGMQERARIINGSVAVTSAPAPV